MDNAIELDWHAGAARPLQFAIYEEDPLDPGQPDRTKPIDLSSATAIRFGVAANATDLTPIFDKTLTGTITVIAGPEAVLNVIRIPILKADTELLAPNGITRLYYEVQVVDGGDDWRGVHGVFLLHPSLL